MRYNVVLFDLDYTLFDSAASEHEALKLSFEEFSIPFNEDLKSRYQRINKKLWGDLENNKISLEMLRVQRFKECLDYLGHRLDPIKLADSYTYNLGIHGGLLPGARELLESLKGNVKLALITNGVGITQRARIKKFDLEQYFNAIVISGEFGSSKPNSAIFTESLRLLQHNSKSDVVMVGDSATSDMLGAQNFGIDSCWFNPQRSELPKEIEVNFIAHSFDQVLEFII